MPPLSPSLVALSDTHGLHRNMDHLVPDGDILVHSGDLCGNGRLEEVCEFADWMGSLPHRNKIIVPGNHDRAVEEDPEACQRIFEKHGIQLLIGEATEIDGFLFFGSPYTPTFFQWHFMKDRGSDIATVWRTIPNATDVLITHGPAYGHGDLTKPWQGNPPRNAGCFELLARLRTLQLQFHIFGHIHEGYGITVSDEVPGTTFVNASTCNVTYQPVNPPHLLRLHR